MGQCVDGRLRAGHDGGVVGAIARLLIIATLLLGVSACADSYDPPIQGDHTSEKYKTDLEKCQTSSMESVRLKNAATLWSWMISPFTGPPAVRAAIRTCMTGKGYIVAKTDD
jgi:hypothetical protein